MRQNNSQSSIPPSQRILQFVAMACCLIVLLCTALTLRCLLNRDQTPAHGDQGAFLELAANIAEGRGFVSDNLSAFQPKPEVTHRETNRQPLYPYLLSLVAGRDIGFLLRAKALTAWLGVAFVLTVFLCVSKRWGPIAGLITLVLLSSQGTFMTLATEVWCENVLMLFLVLCWYYIALAEQDCFAKRSRLWFAVAGVALGAAVLAKSSASMMIASLACALLFQLPGKRRSHQSKDDANQRRRVESQHAKGFVLFALATLVVVLPHLYRTWRATGQPFSSPEISGMMWIDYGPRDAWRVYDTPPTMADYFERHSVGDALRKWGRGLGLVLKRFMGVMSDHPGRLPMGWLLLPFAFFGLWREKTLIRGMMLMFFALNLASFAWYAHVDVAPRFVYPLVVFCYIYASVGIAECIERLLGARTRAAQVVRYSLVGIMTLWGIGCLWSHADWRSREPFPKTLRSEESETLGAIEAIVKPNEVLCMGPSHELAYYWVINRRRVFVPTYTELEDFRSHLDRFNAKYFLLDVSVIRRNPVLLGSYFATDPYVGILPKESIPWLQPVFQNSGSPLRFVLFRISRENSDI